MIDAGFDPGAAPGYRAGWRRPFSAPLEVVQRPAVAGSHDGGSCQGVPLGGFGTGGVGRDWTGSFRRWTLEPGIVEHAVDPAAGFALFRRSDAGPTEAVVLRPREDGSDALEGWGWPAWPLPGEYRAMFPKAWYRYPPNREQPIEAVCEQFSPVIPFDLVSSSLPVGVFRWHLVNRGEVPARAGVLFSFPNRNRLGARGSGLTATPIDSGTGSDRVCGVVLGTAAGDSAANPTAAEWTIGVLGGPGIDVDRVLMFDAGGDGSEVWSGFAEDGRLRSRDEAWITGVTATDAAIPHPAAAVSAAVTLAPGAHREIRFALAWDRPVVEFGGGRRYFRRYAAHFGGDGRHGAALVEWALTRAPRWGAAVDRFHEWLLQGRAEWEAAMLANELYLLVDGSTAWTAGAVDGGPATDFFGILECPDYPFYDTLDLWSYGSWPLAHLWPEVARGVVHRYAAAVVEDDRRSRRADDSGIVFPISPAGTAPHDLGSPLEDPVGLVNAYCYRDPTRWKDLNAHFVLTAWRDARHDPALLEAWYPAMAAALHRLASFDRDGDGLIENDGWPDQTFDNVPMVGPSAYCGGLWIAALAAAAAAATRIGNDEEAAHWGALGRKAAAAYEERLWTGTHYRLDEGVGGEAVFAEQLFGPWWAERTELGPVIPGDRCRRALRTIVECNTTDDGVRTLSGGEREAISQTDEVMVGVNLSLANQLAHFGLGAEAETIRRRIHDGIYRDRGLWFRTPAAWSPGASTFRAILNLRPLVIWAGVGDDEVARYREQERRRERSLP